MVDQDRERTRIVSPINTGFGNVVLSDALVAKRRAEDRVADRRPDHQTEGEDAVDEDPTVDGALGELGVEVQRDSPSAP